MRRDARAWPILVPLLKHRDPQVRLHAACFLLRFDVKLAVPVLEALTEIARLEIDFNAEMTLELWKTGAFPPEKNPPGA